MSGTGGAVHVYTSSSTSNTYGGTAAVGHYALLVGSGSTSTSITASYVATFSSAPPSVTMQGTYVGATFYGFQMKTTSSGTVPVMTGTATTLSGTLAAGAAITVAGTGNGDAILATSVTVGGSTTSTTPSSSPPTHLITADYFGSPDGTTSVSAATAASHLTWAETGIVNTQTIAAAGIKTMVYVDVNRVQTDDPLYSVLSGAEYAETCSGARVSDVSDGVTQYMTNVESSSTRAAAASAIASLTSGHTVNMLFDDNANPLSQFASSYFKVGMPCDYNESTWIADEVEMLDGLGHDVMVNGFSAMTESTPVTNTIDLLSGNVNAGNMESCYVDNDSTHEQDEWVWNGSEDAELKVTNEGKYYQCWGMDATAASSAVPSRLYMLASYLMTYNPTYGIFREQYATPSGLHVMPESQLVPTEPVVAQPSTIATLAKDGTFGVYVREYKACYYAGKLIGQCAMVVNNARTTETTPALTLSYKHTLTLSGNGILDGGSVGFSGAAPPSSMAERSAFIALP